jgi:hypothetical protein
VLPTLPETHKLPLLSKVIPQISRRPKECFETAAPQEAPAVTSEMVPPPPIQRLPDASTPTAMRQGVGRGIDLDDITHGAFPYIDVSARVRGNAHRACPVACADLRLHAAGLHAPGMCQS